MKYISHDNYFVVQGSMLTDLHLKGNELLVYAIIFGFSQKHEQVFHGSIPYLAEFTGASEKTVSRTLQSLTEKHLIIKERFNIDGIERVTYRIPGLKDYIAITKGKDKDKMSVPPDIQCMDIDSYL